MNGRSQDPEEPGVVRETYEEFELGQTRVGMIADPQANNAWIQSDVVQEVVP